MAEGTKVTCVSLHYMTLLLGEDVRFLFFFEVNIIYIHIVHISQNNLNRVNCTFGREQILVRIFLLCMK